MKTKYIDSLKGMCCLIVFVGHMTSLFLPYVYFGTNYAMHSPLEKYLFETPMNLIFNGPSALMCFLLLSGFCLPLSTFANDGKVSVLSKWGEKYLRFVPMALMGCILGWIVMKMDVVYSYRITDLTFSSNYAEWFNNFKPQNFFSEDGPVYDGVIGVFLDGCKYNAPLGTLKYIWTNSLFLLALNKFCQKNKFRYILYAGFFVISYFMGTQTYESFYLGIMLLGMTIADFFYNPYKKHTIKKNPVLGIACMVIGLILVSVPKGYPTQGLYFYFGYIHVTHYLFWTLGWGLIVIAIENVAGFKTILEKKVFLKLGDISFGVFAVHWPLTVSVASYLVMELCSRFSYMHAVLIAMTLTFVLVLVVSWIVQHKVYMTLLRIEKGIIKRLEHE